MLASANSHQQGLSLIELLIANLIGLILLTVLFMVYASSRTNEVSFDSTFRIKLEGQQSLGLIQYQLQQAGYMPALGRSELRSKYFPAATYFPSTTDNVSFTDQAAVAGINKAPNVGSDDLFLRTFAEDQEVMIDCIGREIKGPSLIVSHYYVNNNQQLVCSSNVAELSTDFITIVSKWPAQTVALASNITNFNVDFLENLSSGNYQLRAANASTNWKNVQEVRVYLVLSSGKNQQVAKNQTFALGSETLNISMSKAYFAEFNESVHLKNTLAMVQ